MRLLFLTPQLPYPPRQGTAIRNWGLIKQLSARHAITLLTFAVAAPAPALQAACEKVVTVPPPHRSPLARLRTLLSPHPDLAQRLWSPAFAAALQQLLAENPFDFVQVEGLELAAYSLKLGTRGNKGNPEAHFVYDAHNAEYVIQARAYATDVRQPRRWPAALYSRLQIPRLRRFEAVTCLRAALVSCVSTEDAAALQQLAPGVQPVVVPNGIDLAEYTGQTWPRPERLGPEALVFTGKMDYRPNVDAMKWFITTIWPLVRAQHPHAQLWVVGQQPPPALLRHHQTHNIFITGAVDDTRPYIAHAAVYLAPLRMGGGTRFKLLEAMALTRPIVATRIGAEGFAVRDGEQLYLADTPTAFATALSVLLRDASTAHALAARGRQFVENGYDWRAIVPPLEAAYAQALL